MGPAPVLIYDDHDRAFVRKSQDYLTEYITNDEPGSKDDWKSVRHYKVEFVPFPDTPRVHVHRFYAPDFNDPGWYHSGTHQDPMFGYKHPGGISGYYAPHVGADPMYTVVGDAVNGDLVIPDPDNLDSLTEAGLNTMLPRVKAELSLLNSLWELKDLKELPVKVLKFAQSVKKLRARNSAVPLAALLPIQLRKLKSWVAANKVLATRRGAAGVSSAYLELMFNIRPVISDVIGIHRALHSIAKTLRGFQRRAGKLRIAHYSRAYYEGTEGGLDATVTDWPGGEPVSGGQIACRTIRNVSRISTMYHAEIEYQYWYSDLQDQYAGLLGLLDAVGVNFNPGTVWRAIPFTFLIDWVVGVGRWLDRWKTRNMDPKINIRRYVWSVKRQRTTECRYGFIAAPYSTSPAIHVPIISTLPTVFETAYKRSTTMPSRHSFETSGLSAIEFSLGAALALSLGRPQSRKQWRDRRL